MGIGMIIGGILCLMAGLFSGSVHIIIVGAISIIFGITDLGRKNKDSNIVNDQVSDQLTDPDSRTGIEAARAYLSRLYTDHQFLMRVQKCVNHEELNQLRKIHGYHFTDDDLKYVKAEAKSVEPKSSTDAEKKSNDNMPLDGHKAAKDYLARVKEDHQLRMRVQKCINTDEYLQLARSEGYIFTEEELNQAKEWQKVFE